MCVTKQGVVTMQDKHFIFFLLIRCQCLVYEVEEIRIS